MPIGVHSTKPKLSSLTLIFIRRSSVTVALAEGFASIPLSCPFTRAANHASSDGFEIRYVYKENGGMHTAHNTAYENIDTELNVCVDSDDYMTDDAVEKIINCWNECKSNRLAGIIALDINPNGRVIGKGAFGKVNLALHVCSGRLVAIKSFNKKKLKSKHAKSKIKHEIEILKKLRNPFISQ